MVVSQAYITGCTVGRTWQNKIEDVRKQMKENKSSVLVVTALDEVACEFLVHHV